MIRRLFPFFFGLVFVIILAAMPMMALAEGAAGDGGFFSWELLATFTGAVAAVVAIVQLLKLPLDRIWRIPTDIVVYFVALAVLLLAQAFVPALGGLTLQSGFLCVFNAVLVALAAMSAYRVAIQKVEEKKLIKDSYEYTPLLQTEGYDSEKLATEIAAKIKSQTTATGT